MPNPSPDSAGYSGQQGLDSGTSEFNAISFIVRQMLGRTATATLVQVQAVTLEDPEDPSTFGMVDVVPMVAQITGAGEPTPHATIYGLPYVRMQGGLNAVILDPAVGDIGIAIFADRDISSVKASKAAANPGSRRRFDMADGIYVGGLLNGTPTQYVKFEPDGAGITLVSPGLVRVQAPAIDMTGAPNEDGEPQPTEITILGNVTMTGDFDQTGDMSVDGDIDATGTITGDTDVVAGNISGKTHVHTSALPGSPTSAPVP